MYKERLLTPGPTVIPPAVLRAMEQPLLHHRSETFKRELNKACEGMRWLLGWDSDPIFLAASGTGAMEASLLNTCAPGESIIVVNGGVFGGRWSQIAERLGLKVVEIAVEWGSGVSVEQITRAVTANPGAKAFCIQHSETSTTALHPIESALPEVKRIAPSMLTIVDAISACATAPLPAHSGVVDVYIAGSQKALMLPPGLSAIALSSAAWEVVEKTPKRSLYFDLSKERTSLAGGETSWTPASTLIVGLNAAIEMMRAEGLQAMYDRHALLSRMTRAGLTALGCTLMARLAPCPSVTGIFAPDGIDADELRNGVRTSFGLRLAGGQSKWKSKVVRVGHMGWVDPFDIVTAMSAIGLTMRKLGSACDPAAGVNAALKELAA